MKTDNCPKCGHSIVVHSKTDCAICRCTGHFRAAENGNPKWEANCRGVDESGTPLVAVHGSRDMDAIDRANLISCAPALRDSLRELFDLALRWGCSKEYWSVSDKLIIDKANDLITKTQRRGL